MRRLRFVPRALLLAMLAALAFFAGVTWGRQREEPKSSNQWTALATCARRVRWCSDASAAG